MTIVSRVSNIIHQKQQERGGKALILVAAMSKDGLIGNEYGLPWNIPSEYRHFLELIKGHTMIMGRKSFEIFGGDLRSTTNLVISSSAQRLSNALVFPSFESALAYGRTLPHYLFCGGGASIYGQALADADLVFLSVIPGKFTGDTFFPPFNHYAWGIELEITYPEFEFFVLARSY